MKSIGNLTEEMEAVKSRRRLTKDTKDDIDADRKVERDIENLKLCRKEERAFGGDIVAMNEGFDSQELSDSDDEEFQSFSDSDEFENADSRTYKSSRSNLSR